MLTKAWSAALLNALGDILAQKVVDKNEHLDMKRLGIFTFLVTHPSVPSQSVILKSNNCDGSAVDGTFGKAICAESQPSQGWCQCHLAAG